MPGNLWTHFRGAVLRVFPGALTHAQAVAFAMFLSFFPMLLFFLGILGSLKGLKGASDVLLENLNAILPPGSARMVTGYLVREGDRPARWILLGLTGTILGGMQVMGGFMDGFRFVYGGQSGIGFWRGQWRAFLLLVSTCAPWLSAVLVTVFSHQLRDWMIANLGLPRFFNLVWVVVYAGLALVVAMIILSVLYRVGRPGCRDWSEAVPGAIVATLLWWVVNSSFGFYVQRVPYARVYGGLAAAIGMMVWMYLSAIVVLLGAAYNAEQWGRHRSVLGRVRRVADTAARA
ncbi:MAG: YihY/virulence factor BrkB family protein [Acidobacteria bacterium]|nr:YihY/virulence factor BrkB family protein [Acidobacteriota bacterium]